MEIFSEISQAFVCQSPMRKVSGNSRAMIAFGWTY
jgi:hypothetical protein